MNEYIDKPRELVITLNRYESLLYSLKQKTLIQISEIIENWVLENESEIADNIIGLDERYINCEHAAEIVGQILSDCEINHLLEVGIINGQSHAWVKIGDIIIIDPTKDQFPDISYNDYQQEIISSFSVTISNSST